MAFLDFVAFVMTRDSWRLSWALAIVLAIKVAVLLQLGDHPLLQPSAAGGLDSQYYLGLAERVVGGDLLLAPGLYHVSPLYIYFLAAALAIGNGSLFVAKLLQIGLGTAACGLIWLSAREWFAPRAAWVSLALAALTGALTFYEILLLQAALDPFLAALDCALFTLALRREGRHWPVLAGLAFGVHALNRPNMLLVAAGLACVLLASRSGRRLAPAFVVGLVLALLPLSIRNAAAAGTFWPTPSHGGLNFYIGNNPAADGTYHSVEGITPNIAGQAQDARRVAERALGRPLSDPQVSSFFTRRALEWWRGEPAAAARLFAIKVAYTLNGAWLTLNYSYPFYRDESFALRYLVIGPVLLVPFGLAGLFAHRLAGRPVPRGFHTWSMTVPLTILSVALFFVSARYRVPLLVSLCVTSAGLIDAIWSSVLVWRVRAILLTVAVLVPLLALAGADFGLDDGRREEETQMALALIDRGDLSRAQAYIARAESGHPDAGRFHARIGEALIHANHSTEGFRHLEEAHRLGVRDVRSIYDLAVAYGQQGRTSDAERVLREIALEQLKDETMKDAVADAFTQVALDFERQGKTGQALDAFKRAVQVSPSRAAAHLNLAVAYAQSGRPGEAREEALRALRLDPSYQRARDFLAALSRR